VIDIETTGLSKRFHQITEIAAAKVRNGEIVDSFQTLVNPQVRIPSFITKLTGINNKMVKDSPTVDQVLPAFRNFLGKDIFVAHNATFDFGFLEHNIKHHHAMDLLNHRLCTRKLANRLFPDLARKRLMDLCSHMNVQNHQAHRAMGDVQATVKVFNNMLNVLHEKGISEVDDVLKFERSSIKKIAPCDVCRKI
tara:strand:+ start:546 stop:1127 length:582 start_codon:yes stop_codon:yes gene_type:complete